MNDLEVMRQMHDQCTKEVLRRAGQNSIVLHRILILVDLSTYVNASMLTVLRQLHGLYLRPYFMLVNSEIDIGCQGGY